MATVPRQIAASSDDGYHGTVINIDGDTTFIGNYEGGITSAYRFLNIPKTAFAAATFTLTANDTGSAAGDIFGVLYGHAHDNSPTLTTEEGNITGRANTTASTNTGNMSATVTDTEYSWDVLAQVQEVVGRGGFEDGNALTIIWRDGGSTPFAYHQLRAWDGYPLLAAKLVLETVDTVDAAASLEGTAIMAAEVGVSVSLAAGLTATAAIGAVAEVSLELAAGLVGLATIAAAAGMQTNVASELTGVATLVATAEVGGGEVIAVAACMVAAAAMVAGVSVLLLYHGLRAVTLRPRSVHITLPRRLL